MNDHKHPDLTRSPAKLVASNNRNRPLLSLGQVVATKGVHNHLVTHGIDPSPYLQRHACGDWGDVPPEDAQANEEAVQHGHRILSSYQIHGERVWIITEADRSLSTFLFPQEY